MTRQEAVRALVERKARAMGAHDYMTLAAEHAVRQLRQGHTAHRAVQRGVMLAAELTDAH